ncbi:hypothetical protein B4U80_08642 [Leptotrombidium deliense]|uniref:Beclin 1-associated autophagy-related key regulator-like protein n=1 Tax=Leptotrombidium deliense TaxID=299467 RepID=A0A443S354_9ACAR|nr:hypothetical protein B4U80_08642 [Leptotrombidium deliense]
MAEKLQCFVCCKRNTAFFCVNCIKNGEFTHSRSNEVLKESFAEKKLQFYKLRQFENECNSRLHQLFAVDFAFDNLSESLNIQKVNIFHLKNVLKMKEMEANKANDRLNEILRRKEEVKKEQEKLLKKISSAVIHIEHRKQSIAKRVARREELAEKIKEETRERVSQLTRFVFPIETYLPDENPETGLISSEENTPLLTFSGGSTNSSTNSGHDVKYVVIEPWLPTNGDYSAYDEWVSLHKDCSSEYGQRNPAFRISSALSYATQLLHVISFYLDLRFPKRLKFSEFYTSSSENGNDVFLDENNFAHRVAKLNTNIIYFCLFQNVDSRLIRPKQTIANLQLLSNSVTADLGRTGTLHIDSKFYKKVIENLVTDIELFAEQEWLDASKGNADFDLDWDIDWEFFPQMPNVPDQSDYSQQATSLMSGMLSTAANFGASIWSRVSGQKDNKDSNDKKEHR